MNNKIKIIFGILLVVTMFSVVNAFDYNEDDDGNPFLESEFNVQAPQVSIRDLFILQPSKEPKKPEIGTIYFDADSRRLKLYDGTGWYALALEKVSSVSKQQVKEKVEKKGDAETCEESVECDEWGDCINNYQSMTCITVDENCNKYTDTETRDCESEFELPAKASEGSTTADSSESETATEITAESEDETSEAQEECSEVCEEVCELGEEVCEEVCESDDVCEEVCTEGEEVCEEQCEEVCEIPEQLFDITLDLEENSLNENDKLVAWITLQNFGKRYVPARIIYTVTDELDNEVYKEFEEIRVYTDESIIKRFDNMVLGEGDYVLKLHVEYAGIVEEFSDDFSVTSGVFGSIVNWVKRVF